VRIVPLGYEEMDAMAFVDCVEGDVLGPADLATATIRSRDEASSLGWSIELEFGPFRTEHDVIVREARYRIGNWWRTKPLIPTTLRPGEAFTVTFVVVAGSISEMDRV
jgi:hypothetical protein